MTETVIELEGVDGSWWTLAGPNEGREGVFLASDPKGLYDPKVKVVYEEPGNYPGARYLNDRILRRDITFAVEILNDAYDSDQRGESWYTRDSAWRKAWSYNRDCKLHVTTPESGHRYLKLRLGDDGIEVDLDYDPRHATVKKALMTCVSGDPFWYEPDVIYSTVTTQDTRFDPNWWTPPWPWEELPKEQLSININPLNPTDQYIWLKWTIPASSERIPNLPYPFPEGTPIPWETAPFTQWMLPDYSFEDPEYAERRLKLPGLIIGEDSVVDTDPREEQISADNGAQVWARMNGVRFRHPIPPYTGGRRFHLEVSGAAPGQRVSVRVPRPWSRPWGLE